MIISCLFYLIKVVLNVLLGLGFSGYGVVFVGLVGKVMVEVIVGQVGWFEILLILLVLMLLFGLFV